MSTRRQRASAHASRAHVCRRCGRTFHGNGYRNHAKACHAHIRYAGNIAWCDVVIGEKTKTTDSGLKVLAKDICARCRVRRESGTAPNIRSHQ